MPIYRTRDFDSIGPTYENINGVISDPLVGMVLDPFGPRQGAFSLTAGAFYRTRNLDDSFPSWGTMVLANDIAGGASLTPQFHKLQATIAYQNRIYVVGWRKVNALAGTMEQFVIRTDDGGQTWSSVVLTGAVTSTPGLFTLGQFPGIAIIGYSNVTDPNKFISTASDCVNYARCNGGGYIIIDLGAPYKMTQVQAQGTEVGLNAFTYVSTGPASVGPWTQKWSARPHAGCSAWSSFGAVAELESQYLRFDFQSFALGNWRDYYCMGVYVSSGTTPVPTTPSSALAVGQHNAAKLYVSDGAVIRRSVNSGASFSTYIAAGAYDVECHYAGNSDDNDLRYIAADGKFYTTVGSTPTLRSAWGTEDPVAVAGRIVTFVGDANLIYTLFHDGSSLYSVKVSTDGGNTWDTRSSGHPGARAIGLWPYGNGQIVFMVTDDGPQYSVDGGVTFSNKVGDISGWASPVYIVPVWVTA